MAPHTFGIKSPVENIPDGLQNHTKNQPSAIVNQTNLPERMYNTAGPSWSIPCASIIALLVTGARLMLTLESGKGSSKG